MVFRAKAAVVLAVAAVLACAVSAQAITIDMVTVGNVGNAPMVYDQGLETEWSVGGVDYQYQIGKYEVRADQYTAFLNSVAATDTYGLYNTSMAVSTNPTYIIRSGSSGSYTYAVGSKNGVSTADRPVSYIDLGDAMRFANWMSNGQPTGLQGLSTTEDGSYFLNGAATNATLAAVVREPDATWVVSSHDEWYKAAYHKNDGVTGDYWQYPTQSDTAPGKGVVANATTGDVTDSGNNANWEAVAGTGNVFGPPWWVTRVGAYTNSAGPYGTFDQGGNVREWTDTLGGGDGTESFIWRGGFWGDEAGDQGNTGDFLIASNVGSNLPLESIIGSVTGFRIVNLSAVGGDVVWTGTGGTAWSSTGNWTPASTPNGVMNTFDDTATGLTADIASAATPTSVVFNNSSKNFTITGASGIGGTATVLKQGTGMVSMSSVNTYSGVTTVEAGKLILTGAAKAMVPVLNNGGADIKGGMLVLDYATEADPVATVKSLLTTSYAAGAWNTGKFQSSTASSSRGLGWTDNTSTSKINVAYTVYGDTNLDGTTNFTDLSKLLSKYGQSGVWADGDANYDGTVNFTDLSKMLSTYGQSVGSLTPSPEPSSIFMLVIACLGGAWVIRRRRGQ